MTVLFFWKSLDSRKVLLLPVITWYLHESQSILLVSAVKESLWLNTGRAQLSWQFWLAGRIEWWSLPTSLFFIQSYIHEVYIDKGLKYWMLDITIFIMEWGVVHIGAGCSFERNYGETFHRNCYYRGKGIGFPFYQYWVFVCQMNYTHSVSSSTSKE